MFCSLSIHLLKDIPYVLPDEEIQDSQAGFRKCRGTRDQIANICWIIEKAREFRKKKTSASALLAMPKTLTAWITTNYGKFLKRWEYQTT